MEIYLVRHTTPNIEKGICYGQIDIDITNSFHKEALQISSEITYDQHIVVYSSPLKRCTKLAGRFSNNVIVDNRLMEMNFGDWENKNWNSIPKGEITPWMNDFVNVRATNGESYIDLYKRATVFFDEITSENFDKILIITHSGVIRSILSKINNIALKKSFDIKIAYGQVFKIIKQNNTFTLQ